MNEWGGFFLPLFLSANLICKLIWSSLGLLVLKIVESFGDLEVWSFCGSGFWDLGVYRLTVLLIVVIAVENGVWRLETAMGVYSFIYFSGFLLDKRKGGWVFTHYPR